MFSHENALEIEIQKRMTISNAEHSTMSGKVSSWIRGSLIGAGAFGKVNLALNKENGELFAVKSIECNERTVSEMQAMENEVEILQSLDSAYVVKCLGSSFSVENGKSMRNVLMEYMPGGSLADLMKKFGGRLDEDLIRTYTRSIVEGIHYLHSQGIVHCDIKGKNILVGSSGVKLADFGAARRISNEGSTARDSSHTVNVKGTPLWMAPEVVRQVEQGTPSDIWSLGCTVVEMATGKAPWSDFADPFVALYHIGCTEEVPELPSCLSAEGQNFLNNCFQRDPSLRWTSEQLLKHPFLNECFTPREAKTDMIQSSPTSAFDFPSPSHRECYTSSIVNSVPILSLKRFTPMSKREPVAECALSHNSQKNSEAKQSTSNAGDWWCNSPMSPLEGQWIVVRSPKASPPVSPVSDVPAESVAEAEKDSNSESFGIAQVIVVVDESEPVCTSEEAMVICEIEDEEQKECVAGAAYGGHQESQEAYEPTKVVGNTNWTIFTYLEEDVEGISRKSRYSSRLKVLKLRKASRTRENWAVRVKLQPLKYSSLKATREKLASAHRKMALRGRPRSLGFTLRKPLHELLYEQLMSLARK